MSDNKLAYSIPEACKSSAQGKSTIYEAIKAGKLKARKCGARTIILAPDLEAYLRALPVLGEVA